MEFFMKLPRNKKEFALFLTVISVLSVSIIAPLISCFEVGFNLAVWSDVIKIMPIIWICVVLLVLLTYKPAEWLSGKILNENDSFNAQIIINTLCTVFMMSIVLTVVGTWIGCREISLEPIKMFFYKWPRNFAISFAVESFVAQPFARLIMKKIHIHTDLKNK